MGKRTYLPRLFGPRLRFVPFHARSVLAGNRFSIPEPVEPARRRIRPLFLDLVLFPLVAFDRSRESSGDGRRVLRPHVRGGATPQPRGRAQSGLESPTSSSAWTPSPLPTGTFPSTRSSPTAPPASRDCDAPDATHAACGPTCVLRTAPHSVTTHSVTTMGHAPRTRPAGACERCATG